MLGQPLPTHAKSRLSCARHHALFLLHIASFSALTAAVLQGFKGLVEDFKGVKDTVTATVQAVQVCVLPWSCCVCCVLP